MSGTADKNVSTRIVVTLAGRQYVAHRAEGYAPGTVVERFPGRGVIGSVRAWRGSTWAKGTTWYAAVNRSGEPGKATATIDGLRSRRAAIRWLIEQTASAS